MEIYTAILTTFVFILIIAVYFTLAEILLRIERKLDRKESGINSFIEEAKRK